MHISRLSRSAPQVDGDYHYDSRKQTLLWTVDLIDDTNRSGAMEFVISSAANPDAFFPVDVTFSAQHTLADVKIITVCYRHLPHGKLQVSFLGSLRGMFC